MSTYLERLQCRINSLSYNFAMREVIFVVPEDHCTDMQGAIEYAQR